MTIHPFKLWYLTAEAKLARSVAHKHFEDCLTCSNGAADWCERGLALWNTYTELRTRDKANARNND